MSEVKIDSSLALSLKVLAVLFLIGLFPLPYGYYTLSKIVTCYILYLFFINSNELRLVDPKWGHALIACGVLYNPLIPLHLGEKWIWAVVNAGVLLFLWIILSKINVNKS